MNILRTLFVAAFALFSGIAFAEKPEEVAIGGYCPVCYLGAGKAVKGSSEFKAEHNGETYLFASQEALDTFKKDPEKYLPQYDGYCAFGMSFGKEIKSDPTVFKVVDGKVYLNKNKEVGKEFAKDPAAYIAKADVQWEKIEMKEKEEMKK